MTLLCNAVWESWWAELGPTKEVAYAHIYERDGWRCRCPVCFERNVQPHHILYRSRGGTDDPENVASVGDFCHLGGIHAGVIRAEGTASQMRWLIGSPPILQVSGRDARKWERAS